MLWSIRLPGLIFARSHPKINYFSNFASARFRSKMKWGRSDFPQNYFLLLKFRGKIIRSQTNSADSQTGRQKLRKFCLCPPIGRWPTSPGVHPNYYLSFTTTVDRSFPTHLKVFGSHPSMWWSIRLPGLKKLS